MSGFREHVNEIPNRVAQAVLSGDPEQVRRVDFEVKAVLDAMDVRELLEFADAVRRSYRWYGATRPAWLTLRPSDVRALRHSEAIPTAILGLISFHGNGFIREAALRVLDHVEGGAELRYLLVRLNDWVPEVREAAQRAVRRRLTAEYASAFAFHIGLIVRLLTWGRVNHFETLGWIAELLRGPEGWPRLPAMLDGADAMSRRLLYRLLMDAESEAGRALIRRAMRDSEPMTRLEVMRRLKGAKPRDFDVLHAALRDKFPPVRLLAARELACADSGEPEVAKRAHTALEGWLMRFNSSGAEPSAEQLPRLRNALEAVRERLPADTARELEFCLRR